jgi:hypothetical protein
MDKMLAWRMATWRDEASLLDAVRDSAGIAHHSPRSSARVGALARGAPRRNAGR